MLDWLEHHPRGANLVAATCCAVLLGYALYAQYGLGFEPCPLCIFQRVAVVALGTVFLAAALHRAGPAGRRAWALPVGLVALAGAGVAGRHLWLQSLPPERVPACGPGLDFILEAFPLTEALALVFTGSGECAKVDWRFLGLAMPGWVLLAFAALGVAGVAVNLRAARRLRASG